MTSGRQGSTSTAETQTHPNGPTLPSEVLVDIIARVDPTTTDGRRTLVNLMMVSSFCWQEAARNLYHDVQLDNDRLNKLLAAGRETRERRSGRHYHPPKLGGRTGRALGFIKRLELHAPLTLDCLLLMSKEARLKKAALFENVQQLRVISQGSVFSRLSRDQPPNDVVLFNCPDVCLSGWDSPEYFRWLPLCGTKSVTEHKVQTYTTMMCLPPSWESFTIFEGLPSHFPAAEPEVCTYWADSVRSSPNRHPIDIFLVMESDVERAELLEQINWDPKEPFPTSELRLRFFKPREEAPPCPVCG